MDVQKYIKRLKFARADWSRNIGKFESREDALNFLNGREFFFGDPFVVKYTENGEAKLMLAIGKSENPEITADTTEIAGGIGPDAYELIDVNDIKDQIEKLWESLNEEVSARTEGDAYLQEQVDEVKDAIDNINSMIEELSGATDNIKEIIGEGWTDSPDNVTITDRIKKDEQLSGIVWGHNDGEPYDGHLPNTALPYASGETLAKMVETISDTLTGVLFKDEDAVKTIKFDYNPGRNILYYTAGTENGEIKLSQSAVVDRAYYDAATEELVIEFILGEDEKQEVRIPVRGLITEWTVDNEGHNVKLTRTSVVDGPDVLSADINDALAEVLANMKVSCGLAEDGHILQGTLTGHAQDSTSLVEAINKLDAAIGSSESDITALRTDLENTANTLHQKIDGEIAAREDLSNLVDEMGSDLAELTDAVNEGQEVTARALNVLAENVSRNAGDIAALQEGSHNMEESLETERNERIAGDEAAQDRCQMIQDQLDNEEGCRKAIKLVEISHDKFAELGLGDNVRDAYFVTYHKPDSTEPYELPQPGDAIVKVYKDSVIYKIYFGHVDDELTSPTDPTIIDGTGDSAICFIYFDADGKYSLSTSPFDMSDALEDLTYAFNESQEVTARALNVLAENIVAGRREIYLDENAKHITLNKEYASDGHINYVIGETGIADAEDVAEGFDRAEAAFNEISDGLSSVSGTLSNFATLLNTEKDGHFTNSFLGPRTATATTYYDAINALDSGISATEQSMRSLGNSYELEYTKDSENAEIALKWAVDGVDHVSRINVSDFVKDSFLKNVNIQTDEEGKQCLVFTFKTYDGEPYPIWVPLASLAAIYKDGDGIDRQALENDQVIKIKLDEVASKNWLAVSANGLRVTGVTEAIEEALDNIELEEYVKKDEVEDHLDSASTLPVQNKVVSEALVDLMEDVQDIIESMTAITANTIEADEITGGTIYADEYVNLPTATTEQYGVVVLDDYLDSGLTSENPVQNKAIAKVILDCEEAIAAALNDLNDRKADQVDVDTIQDRVLSVETNLSENYYNKSQIDDMFEDSGSEIDGLRNALNQEVADRQSGDTSISNSLTSTASTLYNMITAETQSRQTADNGLSTSIANEVSARTSADTAIWNAINSMAVDDFIDSAYTSTNPVQNKVISKVILENEEVVAAALNDLNDKKAEQTDLDALNERIGNAEDAISEISMAGLTGVTTTGSGNVITGIEKNGQNVRATLGTIDTSGLLQVSTFNSYTASTKTELDDHDGRISGLEDAIGTIEGGGITGVTTTGTGNVIVGLTKSGNNVVGQLGTVTAEDRLPITVFTAYTGSTQTTINSKADKSYVDNNYYDKTQVDGLLAGKSNTGHTHTIANVTGLQAALDGKSATGHTHTIANVTGLQAALDGKASTAHTHTIANVTGLQAALDGKSATGHTHSFGDLTNTAHTHTAADLPTATTTSYGIVKLDNTLSTGSTNAVVNSAITQTIIQNELVAAAAFNDLNRRKANIEDIPTSLSELEGYSDMASKDYLGGFLPLSGGTMTGNISGSTGNAIFMPGGFFQDSDERLKIFMGDIDNALEKAKQIPTTYFYWKDRYDGPREIGTSAQKVQELFPEIVSGDDKLSVDYSKLAIVALAAVKELSAKVDELQRQINELKK